jgi:ethanolamine ammonia-lyase small subunit
MPRQWHSFVSSMLEAPVLPSMKIDVTRDHSPTPASISDEAWAGLRRLTAACIGLQRSGASLATGPMLALRLAHARARDAVHARLDAERLRADLAVLGLPVLMVASAVRDRTQYLMRPDLGRHAARHSGGPAVGHRIEGLLGASDDRIGRPGLMT